MRSSKSRSRSKSNRQRSIGNIINRVFDSSGPEGKVRGTPQQIIDKYLMLARDAHLGNDRVAEQSFYQHAEHYTRMLSEAMAELAREQEMRQAQQPQQNHNGHSQNGGGQQHSGGQQGGGQQGGQQPGSNHRDRNDARGEDSRQGSGAADVFDIADEGRSSLVETPETRGTPTEALAVAPEPEVMAKPERRAKSPAQQSDEKSDRPPRAPRARSPRKRSSASDQSPDQAAGERPEPSSVAE